MTQVIQFYLLMLQFNHCYFSTGTAGAGIGMIVMAPFTAFLIKQYDWKNALVFIAAIALQTVVAGALLRPLSDANKSAKNKSSDIEKDQFTKTNGCSQRIENEKDKSQGIAVNGNGALTGSLESPINKTATLSNGDTGNIKYESLSQLETDPKKPKHQRIRLLSENDMESYPTKENSANHNSTRSLHSIAHHSPVINHKALFYSGSIHNGSVQYLNSFQSLEQQNGDYTAVEQIKSNGKLNQNDSNKSKYQTLFNNMFDVGLMKNPRFIVVCVANLFYQMGYMIPMLFIPEYGISVGVDPAMAALFLSVFGTFYKLAFE